MGKSRIRRVLVLCSGLAALGLGLGTVGAAVAWNDLDPYLGFYLALIGAGIGIIGVWWWLQQAREEIVDETAPRTVQYVFMPSAPARTYSTVYTPRSHPLEDGMTTRMWSDLQDNTGDIMRMQ